jgi:hypothetical protein
MNSNKTVNAGFELIPIPKCTLSISMTGQGNVSPSAGQNIYDSNSTVSVTASQVIGWHFSHWDGDYPAGLRDSLSLPSVPMDKSKSLTAVFERVRYTLTTATTGLGKGTITPASGTMHDSAAVVKLKATPNSGSTFSEWSGDVTGTKDTVSVIMNGNKSVSAKFDTLYALAVTKTGNGTVTLNPAGGAYIAGKVVLINAIADEGWVFDKWTGYASGTANPLMVTIPSNSVTINAGFVRRTYTVSKFTSGGQGSVTLSPSGPTYAYETEVTVTASPAAGYAFSNWSGDLSGSSATRTFSVTGNMQITANFYPIMYSLNVSIFGEGSVSPDGGVYNEDETVVINASAATGWQFARWSGDVPDNMTTSNPLELVMNKERSITAVFVSTAAEMKINCAGPAAQGFIADNYFSGGSTSSYGMVDIEGTTLDTVLNVERYAEGFGELGYNIPVVDGSYSVSLLFSENWFTKPDQRQFDVFIEGMKKNTGTVDIFADAGFRHAYELLYCGVSVSNLLNIRLVSQVDNAMINGIIVKRESTPVTAYTLTTQPQPSTGGTIRAFVNGAVRKGQFAQGTQVMLVAVPAEGYRFTSFGGGASGSNDTVTVTMNSDLSVTAAFEELPPIEYMLTVTTDGQGTVTASPQASAYTVGTPVVLTAMPKAGWYFDHWSGGAAGTSMAATVVMLSNTTVTAHFSQVPAGQFVLATIIDGKGSVTASPSGPTYNPGTRVSLSATPAYGWLFHHWGRGVSGASPEQTVVMQSDSVVAAYFVPITYALAIEHSDGGTITPSGEVSAIHGDTISIIAVPDTGYYFVRWDIVEGTVFMSDSLHQHSEIVLTEGNVVLYAEFALKHYMLTLLAGEGGTVSPSGDTALEHGASINVSASPVSGYTFSRWIVESGQASISDTASAQTVIVLVSGNATVKALFNNSDKVSPRFASNIPVSYGISFIMCGAIPTLEYAVPLSTEGVTQKVMITMFDLRGRTVAVLVDADLKPGYYNVKLSRPCVTAPGFYVCRMIADRYRGSVNIPLVR